jgi:hypothetical protein
MPGFHYTWICSSEIDLSEFFKKRIIAPQDFHEPAKLIRNNLQVF